MQFHKMIMKCCLVLILITCTVNCSADQNAAALTHPDSTVTLFDSGNRVNHPAKWGSYTVAVDLDNDIPIRISILDPFKRAVKEINCGEYSEVYERRLTPGRVPDLIIVAWSGSNLYCSHTTYVFSQDNGIRNLSITCGGEGQFQRTGHGESQYVMSRTGVLEWACDVCHACEPNLPLVLDWKIGHTMDVTRKYPAMSEVAAAEYRRHFNECRLEWNKSSIEEPIISPAAGYYANEYELGRGRSSYRWIMHRLPTTDTRLWFRDCAKVVRYQISQIRNMTTISQMRVLTTPDDNVFEHPPAEKDMQ
jgi:hypothetical protein